jgi:hypothetical protein
MIDLGPPPFVFPRPAIIRPATRDLSKYGGPAVAMPFMPGFKHKPAATGVTSLSLHHSNSNTSTSISVPGTLIAGDLIVFAEGAQNSSAPAPADTYESGFTAIASAVSGNGTGAARVSLSCKIATGAEAGGSITGITGSGSFERSCLLIFRPDSPIASMSVASVNNPGADDNDPPAQTVTAASGTPPLVVLGLYRSSGSVTTRTMSPAKDNEITPVNTFYLAWKVYNSSPADVSVDMGDNGNSNILMSCYIAVS